MRLTLGLGYGLSRRAGDPKGTIWAMTDRGPNLKIKPASEHYGLERLEPLKTVDGAKIMPRPDIGPTICQLKMDGDAVRLVRRIPLHEKSGRAISASHEDLSSGPEPTICRAGSAYGRPDPSNARAIERRCRAPG